MMDMVDDSPLELCGDAQCVIFSRLCNVLDPGVAVAFGSASNELRELTQAPRQQLKADYEAAAALGLSLIHISEPTRPY